MADVVDRLISRIEFVGIAGAIASIANVVKAQKAFEDQQAKVAAAGVAVARAQDRVNRSLATYNRLAASSRASQARVDRAQMVYLNRVKRLAGAEQGRTNQLGILGEKGANVGAATGMMGGLFGALAFAQFAQITGAAIETSIKFENLRTSLNVLYHDAAKGEEAFSWILQFAKQTPFSVEGLTQAFIRLSALGIQPTRRNLQLMGGLARMFGRDFQDVAMAVGIGASGNFSRLIRGFGITRADVAKNAAPGVVPANGPITNRAGALEAILVTVEKKFPQAFEAFSNTTETARSNFYDSIQQILASFAQLIFSSNTLKDTFKTFVTVAGFVNNFIKVLDIFKNALIFTITQLLSIIPSILGKLLPGKFGGNFFGGIAGYLDTASRAASEQILTTLKGMSKYQGEGEPPKLPNGALPGGEASPMGQFIRQVVGSSGIAQIGVNASELPGLQGTATRKPTVTVRLESSEGSNFERMIEEAMNKLLYDANRHGFSLQPNHG